MTENKRAYDAIVRWVENPSVKNFFKLYKDGFTIRFILWRPMWRVWRIIRNTVTGRYKQIANDNSLKEKYSK